MSFEDKASSHQGHSIRGVGAEVRLPFCNDQLIRNGWTVEEYGKGFRWTNKQGKKFFSSKAVQSFLQSEEPLFDEEDDADYVPSNDDCSPEKQPKRVMIDQSIKEVIELPVNYYIGMTCQLQDFVDQINLTHQCTSAAEECTGKLVPIERKVKGLGGGVKIAFACSGCQNTIHFASSKVALDASKRQLVSWAVAICFLVYGHGYPMYHKILRMGLGINILAKSNFYNVLKVAHPHARDVLMDMCNKAKNVVMKKDKTTLGSWERAVTSSDGCWLIRGFHSQCASFVIVDFLTGGILYYGHLCMRGSNRISDTDLWEGTSKSAEGHLAYELFKQAKDEGMNVELNWQDQDSSSGLSFRSIFPDDSLNRIMLCGGHVGRSHGNNLKEYKGKKHLEKAFIDKHKEKFPKIAEVKCVCAGKKHSKNCGCLNDSFILAAKRNHFSALKQSQNDPEEYGHRMRCLGKYHARDIHEWTENNIELTCGFHPKFVCSCGKCGQKEKENVERSECVLESEEAEECDGSEKSYESEKDDDVDEKNGKEVSRENSSGEEVGENISDDSTIEGSDRSEDNSSEESGSSGRDSNVNASNEDSSGESECEDAGNDSQVNVSKEDSSSEDESEDESKDESKDDASGDSESEDSDEEEDDLFKCAGKPYHARNILKCDFHALLYEIECEREAKKAKDIVHEEMGRGHSNLPESKFSVLTRFRPKSTNLHQTHYEFSTNIGLCQSNITFMYKHVGPKYHWLRDLLERMNLPLPEGIEDIWETENEERMKRLNKQKTDKAKIARVKLKQNRMKESKTRRKFVLQQKIVHGYGDEETDENETLKEVQRRLAEKPAKIVYNEVKAPKGARVTISGKKCKCGSTEHQRTSHKSCPLNKKSKAK